jgi:hypothetical protein
MIMADLRTLLFTRTWYALRAIAYAYAQDFGPRMTKAESVDYIAGLLRKPRLIRQAVEALPDDAREALQALLACGGAMDAHRFLAHFGPLPPYRPWRDDSPPKPWRHPASPAEQLWFLGLIFLFATPEGEIVLVPGELRPFLPDPSPPAAEPAAEAGQPAPDAILDVAHLLAFLQGCEVRPFAGRWLAPHHLKRLNAALSHPDPTVVAARSELQTGYLRFLHYLAEIARLVAPAMGLLKPAPAAWPWLDAPEAERWHILWRGWQADLHRPLREPALWTRFRLPAALPFARTVFDLLSTLPEGHGWRLSDLAVYIRGRCIGAGSLPPDDDVLTPLRALLTGPMTWAGLANVTPADPSTLPVSASISPLGRWLLGRLAEPPPSPPIQPAAVACDDQHVIVTLPTPPGRPRLRPLVELALSPTGGSRSTRCLAREQFVAGLARGISHARIVQLLGEISGQPPAPAVVERLEAWESRARGLTLRRLTVLSGADAAALNRLSAERHIRPHLRETLSPHHVVVDPASAERLLRTLRRRGHTPLVEPDAVPQPLLQEDPANGASAYLWLALRAYLDLADLVQLPVAPPADLLDRLGATLDAERLAALATQAQETRRRILDAIDGYTPFPAPLPGVDQTTIQAALERALAESRAVEIVYHTAGRGERTTRVVEPLRLEPRGGALYLVAYCHLRQSERIFRLDRIASVRDVQSRD